MKKKIIKSIKRIMIATILTIIFLSIIVFAFLKLNPTFGGKAEGESLKRIQNSENYNGEIFVNKVSTTVITETKNKNENENESMISSLISFFFPPKEKNPTEPLPSVVFKKEEFKNGDIAWFGHSTVLFKINNKVILTDPVFNNASPVPFTVQPFEVENKTEIKDLPEKIDIVIISHDHYDHLDYKAIKELNNKTDKFLVGLGVGAHLLRWGVPEEKIQEFDWYEETEIHNIFFAFTPARHFSGRSISDGRKTLWGSWVVKSENLSFCFLGDTGYFDEFKKIGEKYGPFDLGLIENGAYNEGWSEIHMFPEQSVQASIDLKVKTVLPVHWAKFDLSRHTWIEPIEKTTKEAERKNVNLTTPLIGQVFNLENLPKTKWWESVN